MSEVTPSRMKVSREGIVLIKSFEGFRAQAVARPEGGWVIGYGHTASAREGLTVGEADAELLLQYDLIPVVKALHERVTAAVNQHQFDALASFAFSLGVERFAASDVLARVNAGAAAEAADALFGWPETQGPEAALRRRAAERALFVAAPEAAVTLADLLSAPLPLPAPETAVEPPSASGSAEDARAAAVAMLLGETGAETPSGDVEAVEEAPPVEPAPSFDPQQNRYSPYSTAPIGPLPALEPSRSLPAVNLSPIAVAPEPIRVLAPEPVEVEAAEPDAVEPERSEPQVEPETVASQPTPEPVVEPLIVEPAAPEPLVLTPLSEAPAADPRPLWSAEQRVSDSAASDSAPVLFEDQGGAELGAILRHEAPEAGPRRRDWSETGAFAVMGGIGLVSFGAAMAAFRRAAQEGSGGDQTALIGWVLALIALICVGVSSFNLYQRWGAGRGD